jgi:phosphinothricin acetyltransferase
LASSIRLATENDAEEVREIYAPFCLASPVSFETEAPTAEEMRGRIDKTLKSLPWIVYEADDGQVLGYAYASRHRERAAYRWSVDVSAYVKDGFRRGGIGRALYTSLVALLRLQGFYNAVAGITLPNPGSVGLHESMGFEPVGVYRQIGFKRGQWHDVAWYHLRLREHGAEPPPDPIAFNRVREQPAWANALASGLTRYRCK